MTQTAVPLVAGRPARWLAVVAVVVALMTGFGAGVLFQSRDAPGDDPAAAGFARDMSVHHAQAVQMAMIASHRATNATVRGLGSDIALTQQAQIGMMNQWLRDQGLNLNSSEPRMAWMRDGSEVVAADALMPGMATTSEMQQLEAAKAADVDRLFLEMMIKHHLGGVHMADAVLELSDDSTMTLLAQQMKNGQQGEISLMQSLLAKVTQG